MSFAGPCEWCGGHQAWTVIRGEVYTSCDAGCAPLPGLGLDPPHDSEQAAGPPEDSSGTRRSGEGRADFGSEANESVQELPEPPAGWLSSMWLGGSDGETNGA